MKKLSCGFLFLLLAACFLLTTCHMAESIDASVIDAESGQPVEGMLVIADWQAVGRMTNGNNEGQIMVMETMTDKKGHVAFPSWGPKIAWMGSVNTKRARLLLFKSGYQPLVLSNEVKTRYGYSPIFQSEWNGKAIKVHAANADPVIRIQDFDLFNVDLRSIVREASMCPWTKIPNTLREVRKERLVLEAHAMMPGAWPIASVDEDLISNAEYLSRAGGAACGSPRDIFVPSH